MALRPRRVLLEMKQQKKCSTRNYIIIKNWYITHNTDNKVWNYLNIPILPMIVILCTLYILS